MFNVIFDMDGVIFDSERTLLDCWLEISASYGLDGVLVRNTYIQCIGTNRNQSTEIITNAFRHVLTAEKISSIWDESAALYRRRYSDGNLPVKPGVKEILEYLKAENCSRGGSCRGCPCGSIRRRHTAPEHWCALLYRR